MDVFERMRREALRNHCRLAGETLNVRFARGFARQCVSVVLTVNSGYE